MIFKIDGSNETGLKLGGAVFFPFKKIGFSLQFYKHLRRLPVRLRDYTVQKWGFAIMFAPSFKNLPESLSTPAALELSIFVIIFKTFSSEVLLKQKLRLH